MSEELLDKSAQLSWEHSTERKEWGDKIVNHLIESIQYYEEIFPSRIHVLSHMLLGYGTGYGWEKGELLTCYDLESDEKPQITYKKAQEMFLFAHYQRFCSFGNWAEQHSPLFNIPDDVTIEWLAVIKDFIYEINKIEERAYQLIVLSRRVDSLGLSNPNTYSQYDSTCTNFKKLREITNQIAKDRGWKHYTLESLHDPVKNLAVEKNLNNMITEILTEADDIVPKARRALNKRDAREFVERHGAEVFKEVIAEIEGEQNNGN